MKREIAEMFKRLSILFEHNHQNPVSESAKCAAMGQERIYNARQ